MKVINLSENNSLLQQFLREIRDTEIQKDPLRFRRNIERIGELMAYEVSKHLHYQTMPIQTPLAPIEATTIADSIVLATILRAGLPLHQGFLNMFDGAENAFLSAYRKKNDVANGVDIVAEYMAAPSIEKKTLIMVDPMLATGMSMQISYQLLVEQRGCPKDVHLCSVIGTPDAVSYLSRHITNGNVTLWCAAIDPILNDDKYIVPGLGDAGDLCFGSKL